MAGSLFCLVLKFYVSLVFWFYSFPVLQFSGSLVPWFYGSCFSSFMVLWFFFFYKIYIADISITLACKNNVVLAKQ